MSSSLIGRKYTPGGAWGQIELNAAMQQLTLKQAMASYEVSIEESDAEHKAKFLNLSKFLFNLKC